MTTTFIRHSRPGYWNLRASKLPGELTWSVSTPWWAWHGLHVSLRWLPRGRVVAP